MNEHTDITFHHVGRMVKVNAEIPGVVRQLSTDRDGQTLTLTIQLINCTNVQWKTICDLLVFALKQCSGVRLCILSVFNGRTIVTIGTSVKVEWMIFKKIQGPFSEPVMKKTETERY